MLEFQIGSPFPLVHLHHFAAARGGVLDHRAGEIPRHVHREDLHRFGLAAVDLLVDDLRLADHELVALAAHRLHQDGQVQDRRGR